MTDLLSEKEEILEKFYDAMPDDLTIEDCATGVLITFQYKETTYKINTRDRYSFRCYSMDAYYKKLEQSVMDTVKDAGHADKIKEKQNE